jgi:hypothetical protein
MGAILQYLAGYELDDRGIVVQFSTEARYFSLLEKVQASTGSHTAS